MKVAILRIYFLPIFALLGTLVADEPRDRAVEIVAEVQGEWPVITLRWRSSDLPIETQKIYRRLKGDPLWGEPITSVAPDATVWIDGSAVPGIGYEYRVTRKFASSPGQAAGYLHVGYDIEMSEKGRIILIAEEIAASALESECDRWREDLVGDGWKVTSRTVSRDASPPQVREIIREANDEGSSPARALVLFGQVPVPYSGDHAPDGHSPGHRGAWPADSYYADLDGEWTDTKVNVVTAVRPDNRNVPGDGKFDNSSLPSDVDLETGRIDLSNMLTSGVDEITLLKQYLDRNHNFRHRNAAFSNLTRTALIDDQFQSPANPFAANGWRNFIPLFGPNNVKEGRWFESLDLNPAMFAMASGFGNYTAIRGVGTSSDFALKPSRAVFTLLSGSYFGDWNVQDNLLRAPLVGNEQSLGLTCLWTGRPDVHLFAMALGETIGYGVRVTQNNNGDLFSGYIAGDGVTARGTHIALMGDPTLRLHSVAAPEGLNVAVQPGSGVNLWWSASAEDTILGYKVFTSVDEGDWLPVAGTITTTAYQDTEVISGQSVRYRVHTVKRETSPSGTYWNTSQAVFAESIRLPDSIWPGPRLRIENDDRNIPIAPASTVPFAKKIAPNLAGHELNLTLRNVGAQPLTVLGSPQVEGMAAPHYEIKTSLQEEENAILEPDARLKISIHSNVDLKSGDSVNVVLRTDDPIEPNFNLKLLPDPLLVEKGPQSYFEWIETFETIDKALQSFDADPDGDTISNAEEYAYGGRPDVADSVEDLMPGIERDFDEEHVVAALAVKFRQLKDATGNEGRGSIGRDYRIRDVRYQVELSIDGENWNPVEDEIIETHLPTDNGDGTSSVVVLVREFGSDGIAHQARIKVSIAERPLTYSIWTEGFPGMEQSLTDPLSDADGDGSSNLEEYALGGNPTVPDAASRMLEIVELDPRSNAITVSYRRRIASDLSYRIEISDTLQSWLPWDFGAEEILIGSDEGFETLNTRVFEPLEGKEIQLRFIRVQISLNSN